VLHLSSIRITFGQEIVGALGRANGSILSVLVDQQLRGAEYVGVVDHASAHHTSCRHKFAMNQADFN
jgi:hypothetical protein